MFKTRLVSWHTECGILSRLSWSALSCSAAGRVKWFTRGVGVIPAHSTVGASRMCSLLIAAECRTRGHGTSTTTRAPATTRGSPSTPMQVCSLGPFWAASYIPVPLQYLHIMVLNTHGTFSNLMPTGCMPVAHPHSLQWGLTSPCVRLRRLHGGAGGPEPGDRHIRPVPAGLRHVRARQADLRHRHALTSACVGDGPRQRVLEHGYSMSAHDSSRARSAPVPNRVSICLGDGPSSRGLVLEYMSCHGCCA